MKTNDVPMKTLAYHSNPVLKERYLARMSRHQQLDHIVQNLYWNPFTPPDDEDERDRWTPDPRGCSIGCTIAEDYMGMTLTGRGAVFLQQDEPPIHVLDAFARDLGVPRFIAAANEIIFEELPEDQAKAWPLKLLEAIPVGTDLSHVLNQLIFLMIADMRWESEANAELAVKVNDFLLNDFAHCDLDPIRHNALMDGIAVAIARARQEMSPDFTHLFKLSYWVCLPITDNTNTAQTCVLEIMRNNPEKWAPILLDFIAKAPVPESVAA